jgi:hypothetical protein
MKTNNTPQLGILDALTAGLRAAIKHPWLIVIPAIVDLALWLSPRLAIDKLVQRFLVVWEAFFRLGAGANQAVTGDMIATVREGMTQIGQSINLAEAVTGSWLAMPSAVATIQTSRLMLVSDVILAPMGIGLPLRSLAPAPWQPAAIEINSFWGALLIVVGLWLVGQLIVAFFLSWAAVIPVDAQEQDPQVKTETSVRHWVGLRGLLALTLRLGAYTLPLTLVVIALYVPLSAAMLIVASSGSAATGLLFAATGGMTLWLLMWLLTSLFFVSEALVLEGLSFWQGLKRSFGLARQNAWRTVSMVIIINTILLGFRAIWGLLGQTLVGAVISIAGNAYLTTAMLLAVYIYYAESCRRVQAATANGKRQTTNRG